LITLWIILLSFRNLEFVNSEVGTIDSKSSDLAGDITIFILVAIKSLAIRASKIQIELVENHLKIDKL
jgi:hypothetical protein